MADSVTFGLKNVHYAFHKAGLDGATEFEKPVHINGAVSLTMTREGEETSFYAEDRKFFSASQNDGYTGTLTVAEIPDEFLVGALGWYKGSDGAVYEDADGVQKSFVLMFQTSGNINNECTSFYSCKVSRPEAEANTKTKSTEVDTKSLAITMVPMEFTVGSKKMNLVKSTKKFAAGESTDSYFSAVAVPTAAA